jgi:hypothetical protein
VRLAAMMDLVQEQVQQHVARTVALDEAAAVHVDDVLERRVVGMIAPGNQDRSSERRCASASAAAHRTAFPSSMPSSGRVAMQRRDVVPAIRM